MVDLPERFLFWEGIIENPDPRERQGAALSRAPFCWSAVENHRSLIASISSPARPRRGLGRGVDDALLLAGELNNYNATHPHLNRLPEEEEKVTALALRCAFLLLDGARKRARSRASAFPYD